MASSGRSGRQEVAGQLVALTYLYRAQGPNSALLSRGAGEISGPPTWKGVCATGKRQSPINIPLNTSAPKVEAEMGEFDFAYGSFEQCDVLNTGHGTMQVRMAAAWQGPAQSAHIQTPEHLTLFLMDTCAGVSLRRSFTRTNYL